MNIFSPDSSFSRVMSKFFDLLILNFLFLFTTFIGFGFTFGASFTAMIYTVYESFRCDQEKVWKYYFKSFKENFKQTTKIWSVMYIIMLDICFTILNPELLGSIRTYLIPVQYFLLFEIFMTSIFAFSILSKFHMPTKQLLVQSVLIAHKHIFTSIVCITAFISLYLLSVNVNFIFSIVIFSITGYLIERLVLENLVIAKYSSEEDKELLEIKEFINDETC